MEEQAWHRPGGCSEKIMGTYHMRPPTGIIKYRWEVVYLRPCRGCRSTCGHAVPPVSDHSGGLEDSL